MNTMIYFDTLKCVETLKEAGIPEQQAKAFVRVQQEALSESLDTTVATKMDIQELKAEIAAVKAEIAAVKTELKTEIAEVKADVRLLKWMIGFVFTGVTALVLKTFF